MSELLDRLKGNVNEAAGKAKRNSDDPETRAEGAAQEIKGKAQQVKASLKAELSSDTK
ncbi:CsbD family protein [Parasphingorhabdus flavimaris]|uniref:CsbD family protein n=1 Tax=Parasphingorhabdus flavimaris TaxID=266812 RepID=UPI003001E9FA